MNLLVDSRVTSAAGSLSNCCLRTDDQVRIRCQPAHHLAARM
jgi:hypothetical protein